MSSDTCPFKTGQTWYSFQRQERKLVESIAYVALDEVNLKTWGEGYADLLRSVGDDVDSFFREMASCPARGCRYLPRALAGLTPSKPIKDWRIDDYRATFEPIYNLSQNEVSVGTDPAHSLARKPFGSFGTTQPGWWTSYNRVKHQYYEQMKQATLENVLDAMGGLVILNSLHKCSQEYLVGTGMLVGGTRHRTLEQKVKPEYLLGVLRRSATGTPASRADVASVWMNTRVFHFKLKRDPSS